ncbi:MAG: hypothetical protein HY069_00510 [Chlamydiia bacterium]|nr:hypothetical protein [Chlamydiia bacterium]
MGSWIKACSRICCLALTLSGFADLATPAATGIAYHYLSHLASYLSFRRCQCETAKQFGYFQPDASYPQVAALYQFALFSHTSGEPSESSFSYGLSTKVDAFGNQDTFLGQGVGYDYTHVTDTDKERVHLNIANSYFYVSHEGSCAFFEAVLLGAYNRITQRWESRSNFQFCPQAGFGGDFQFDWGTVEPYTFWNTILNFQSSFSAELNATFGLRVYEKWKTSFGFLLLREFVAYIGTAVLDRGAANFNSTEWKSTFDTGVEFLIRTTSTYLSTQYSLAVTPHTLTQACHLSLGYFF